MSGLWRALNESRWIAARRAAGDMAGAQHILSEPRNVSARRLEEWDPRRPCRHYDNAVHALTLLVQTPEDGHDPLGFGAAEDVAGMQPPYLCISRPDTEAVDVGDAVDRGNCAGTSSRLRS
jgi:hypothetical protein